ncbi:hypothetical protein SAMN06273572_101732 [Monaibacterium marinum]|uniref:Uncharacterized protein n=1 Tax=Pontivivens marinum TaxID=1690039 RepID=A0A2C9CMX5_9RHOB|nr:hypothetical protein SAMN06273572_101732 [Monaibacterium marinum]
MEMLCYGFDWRWGVNDPRQTPLLSLVLTCARSIASGVFL